MDSDSDSDSDSRFDPVAEDGVPYTESAFILLQEMESQGVAFLLAGYETTSTAMAFMSYNLATHREVQEKLQREIDEHFSSEVSKI